MRKLLYWIIPLIGVAYTLWMMIIMFKGMPHPALTLTPTPFTLGISAVETA
jgi:hypothetical protein